MIRDGRKRLAQLQVHDIFVPDLFNYFNTKLTGRWASELLQWLPRTFISVKKMRLNFYSTVRRYLHPEQFTTARRENYFKTYKNNFTAQQMSTYRHIPLLSVTAREIPHCQQEIKGCVATSRSQLQETEGEDSGMMLWLLVWATHPKKPSWAPRLQPLFLALLEQWQWCLGKRLLVNEGSAISKVKFLFCVGGLFFFPFF